MAVAAEAMSEDERSQFERLTGTQKSAILMMLLERMKRLRSFVTYHPEKFSIWVQPCILSRGWIRIR